MALATLSHGVCYFPDCQHPVVVFKNGIPYVDVQIAHIYDANPGNRYRASMTNNERRSFKNLILLCKPHHEIVDKYNPGSYTAETLTEWKTKHERGDVQKLAQENTVQEDDLEKALIDAAISISESELFLGGHGGTAPGSGGGGGGAIGPGAIAGGGGSGGQSVHSTIPLRGEDIKELKINVGKGGAADQNGEDSYVEAVRADGTTVEILRASGGEAGLSGVALGDQMDGPSLTISSCFMCDAAQIKDGLLNIWGGGWDYAMPDPELNELNICIAVIAEARLLNAHLSELQFELLSPTHTVHKRERQIVSYDANQLPHRIPIIQVMNASPVNEAGHWRIIVSSGGKLLAETDFMLNL